MLLKKRARILRNLSDLRLGREAKIIDGLTGVKNEKGTDVFVWGSYLSGTSLRRTRKSEKSGTDGTFFEIGLKCLAWLVMIGKLPVCPPPPNSAKTTTAQDKEVRHSVEIKPSFFSISGFLVPGIVFFASLAFLLEPSQKWLLDEIRAHFSTSNAESAHSLFESAIAIAVVSSLALVVGSMFSEIFLILIRYGVRRPFLSSSMRKYTTKLFGYSSLKNLLQNELDARESYAYQKTCGLDLHWFAGRIRMVGGSGLAILVAAVIALFCGSPCKPSLLSALAGVIAMGVSIYRAHRFDEYIAVTAATSYWLNDTGIEKNEGG